MATPVQRAEQADCLIAKIGSGSTANVWLSVPVSVANTVLAAPGSPLSEDDKIQACKVLRGAMQATKIAVPFADNQMYDLSEEITVLQDLSTRHLYNATKIMNSDSDPIGKVWFSTELLDGGTLEQFPANLDLTENFAWHCIRQITETILAVYFGEPRFYQGDVRTANMMFRTHRQEGVFPDLVLIDFGQSKKIGDEHGSAFFDRQREDVRECFKILSGKMTSINELRGFAVESERLLKSDLGKIGNRSLEKVVRDVHELASGKTGEYDLSADLIEYFGAALRTEDGRPITSNDLLSCRTSKEEPDDAECF